VDPQTKKAAVIDPVRDIDPLMQKIHETGAKVEVILETHVHADFVSGSKELKHKLWGIPAIYCSSLGGSNWIPHYADVAVEEHENISLGSLRLQAWHTPGHTPEHVMWLLFDDEKDKNVPQKAFTGDFLFVGCIGRPDLLGDSSTRKLSEQLFHSIFDILPKLPNSLEIYPGHGAGSLCGKNISSQLSSTLALERQNNPFLKAKEKEQWMQGLLDKMPPSPDYFVRMKNINLAGPLLLSEQSLEKEINQEALHQLDPTKWSIIDIRDKEEFARQHVKGSINIGYGPLFLNWVTALVPYEKQILLVAANTEQRKQAIKEMRMVGYDNFIALLTLNKETEPLFNSAFPMITTLELKNRLEKSPENTIVLDVRSHSEWNAGHIEGAKHIALKELTSHLAQIPKEKAIAVTCGSGYRSSIAASMLQREGYQNVCNVQGGMQGWMNAGYPTIQ
jgi:hydroxyacylglutathione hydrolase